MTGNSLITLAEELNGGASIGSTLLLQLLNLAKATVEEARPWMVLRGTDTSKTVSASTNAWQTAIDLSTITDFSRFYGDEPIKNFDGTNRTDYFRQVPLHDRLRYKDASGTFIFNDGTKALYLNGTVSAGTLWIDYLKNTSDVAASDTATWTVFPTWAHPILAFMAVTMHKGGVDYDDVNASQAMQNNADAARIFRMLETWDNEKQLAAIQNTDPSRERGEHFRPNAINM